MRRITIGRRLTLAFSMLVGLGILGLGVGTWAVSQLAAMDDEVIRATTERITLGEFQNQLNVQNIAFHQYLLEANDAALTGYTARRAETLTFLSQYLPLTDANHAAELQSAVAALNTAIDGLVSPTGSGAGSAAGAAQYRTIESLFEGVEDIIEAHEVNVDQAWQSALAQADGTRRAQLILFGLLIVSAVVGGTLFSIVINRSITHPARSLTQAAGQLAGGDLSAPIRSPGADELTELAASFESMRLGFSTIVSELQSVIARAGALAAEIMAQAQIQASASTEQAATVAEVTASIEELSHTAQAIAEMADRVARAAERALAGARAGQAAADALVQGTEDVQSKMTAMAQRILALGERSQQIGAIVALIGDIASETHLLSLNASIEAASAGEHGKRFAVVAAEVKRLAERAATSTGEVRSIVTEMQAAANSAVVAVEAASREAARAAEQAQHASEAIDSMVEQMGESTQVAREISLATQQQQSASAQVVAAMHDLSAVTEQMAIGSHDTSTAAAQLTEVAADLTRTAGRFRVRA
ncbi:MAG TPA: methyl-accepting chemotaxis protein [Anaerolineae bacterium]|nr:methyl-accepting chemotaxis protein [Anaerolineae bacterium]